MPRETQAQRQARADAERAKQLEIAKVEHFPRVMAALEKASKFGWSIAVINGVFVVTTKEEEHVLPVELPDNTWCEALHNLEYEIDEEAYVREREHKIFLARQSALAKLTQEEKEALGIK